MPPRVNLVLLRPQDPAPHPKLQKINENFKGVIKAADALAGSAMKYEFQKAAHATAASFHKETSKFPVDERLMRTFYDPEASKRLARLVGDRWEAETHGRLCVIPEVLPLMSRFEGAASALLEAARHFKRAERAVKEKLQERPLPAADRGADGQLDALLGVFSHFESGWLAEQYVRLFRNNLWEGPTSELNAQTRRLLWELKRKVAVFEVKSEAFNDKCEKFLAVDLAQALENIMTDCD